MNKIAFKSLIKNIYDKIVCMIDNDECDTETCSEEDIISYQALFSPKVFAAEKAAKFLEISDYKFKLMRKKGLIPEPLKIVGLKQKLWTKSQLIKVKEEMAKRENN